MGLASRVDSQSPAMTDTPPRSPSKEHQANFILRLLTLLREYDALLYYTASDDGIHIDVCGEELLNGSGFFDQEDLVEALAELGVQPPPHPRP